MTAHMQARNFWNCLRRSALLGWLLQWVYLVPSLADDLDDDDDDYDALPWRTEEQIDALIFNFDEVVETIAVYVSFMSVLLVILLLAVALRLKAWAAYIGLTVLSMVWFALFEQTLTGLYWLGFNLGYAEIILAGFVLASLHLMLAGASIDPEKSFGRLRPLLFLCAVLVWGVLAMNWPISYINVQPAFLAVALVACFGHVLAIPSFFATKSATVEVTRNGLAFVTVALIAVMAFIVFGEIVEDVDFVFLGRLAILTVVTFFSVFLVRHALVLLRDRDQRIQNELETAQREAEQNRVLLETEQKYSRARDAAERHTLRLATASHDIRQPIVSLRSMMATVAKDQPKDVSDHLNAALDYLDKLAESYIDSEEDADEIGQTALGDKTEVVETQMICATLDRMFRKEAEAKHLTFIVDVAQALLATDPLAVMRILSNLISNAIKHTPSGDITLRGASSAGGYDFTVFNSANLPKDIEGKRMFESFEKGENSTGTGLGLSIVDSLSNRYGMTLTWTSKPGQGTTFRLAVPSS